MHIDVDYLSNRLTVEGDPNAVARAKALLVAGADSARDAIGFRDVAPLAYTGSYEESTVAAWGCWGDPIVSKVVDDRAGSFSVTFDTSQSAPEKAMAALSRLVPEAVVRLDCVWSVDPAEVSGTGRWVAGEGSLEPCEANRDHYLLVRPDTEDWDLDDHFPPEPAGP